MSQDWSPDRIKLLTDLWNEGLATGEIGRRLGFTKNAVIGKAHRLGLAKRQSPIQRTAPAPVPAKRPQREAPPPRGKPAAQVKAEAPAPKPQPVEVPIPVIKTKRLGPQEAVTLDRLGHGMCCWPIGEPGTPEFRFCGEETLPGKPYCAEHCATAYVHSSKGDKDKAKERANRAA